MSGSFTGSLDFELGLPFVLAMVIHEFVAAKKLPDGARLKVRLDSGIEEADYNTENLDSTCKYAGDMSITLEL
ncbi:MAG: hypothetical protein AB7U59_07785 [Desulfovibrionaceae bacterium]